VGMGRYARNRSGDGIKIGVVDTGVGPHPYLSHVRSLGSTAGAAYDPSPEAGVDVQQHGTHVCGIIAARPVDGSGDYAGIADGADVMAIRVFPPDGAADQGDIAEAIDLLAAEHDADLINLSLGSPQPSAIERDAIIAAAERGTLCCAAAGNSFGGPTMYPAAYPETAAVSALGLTGTSPPGTMAAHATPLQADKFAPGGLFLADFSNLGPEIICAAPGVGIISTVPARAEVVAPYASKSGTSMASPIVCAAVATLLSHDRAYLGLPRGVRRAQRAAATLAASLQPVELSPLYVGGGLSRAWPI